MTNAYRNRLHAEGKPADDLTDEEVLAALLSPREIAKASTKLDASAWEG